MASESPHGYRRLDAARIVATIAQLEQRIGERFPGAGLVKVCAELHAVASQSSARAAEIGKPNVLLRLAVALILAASLALLLFIVGFVDTSKTAADNVYTVLQGVEATMNLVVLMGVAILSLVTIEDRIKRRKTLAALHELRSIIHVIDMHQLTKDPSAAYAGLEATEHSPKRVLTVPELERYLDYCSEMLSLSAKVAALYAQSFPDAVVTDAVSDIERMSANLSQKVWQKIMILEAGESSGRSASIASGAAVNAGSLAPVAARLDAVQDDVPDPRV